MGRGRSRKISILRIGVHIGAWALMAWLLVDALTGNLTVNPIQAATQRTGKYALVLLVLSLACTPANTLLGWRQALTVRRALGLYAFMYAAIHFFIFIGLDFAFDLPLAFEEILAKRYTLVGMAALFILTMLAATSFKWWMRKLGKNWKRLHKLIYLASGLVIVHFTWSQKGDLLRLQGDILEPLAFGIAVALLLAGRLPPVRKAATGIRQRLIHRFFSQKSEISVLQ